MAEQHSGELGANPQADLHQHVGVLIAGSRRRLRGRPSRAAAGLVTLAVFAGVATVASAAGSASGKLCGASGCRALPRALAMPLSEQNDAFTPAGRPRPAPYYKIVVHGTGDGHLPNRTIIWVPSKKVWWDAADHTPYAPLQFWRSEGTEKDFPGLAAFAAKVKPYPAPKRWALPHY
jgi:hypothetical protein